MKFRWKILFDQIRIFVNDVGDLCTSLNRNPSSWSYDGPATSTSTLAPFESSLAHVFSLNDIPKIALFVSIVCSKLSDLYFLEKQFRPVGGEVVRQFLTKLSLFGKQTGLDGLPLPPNRSDWTSAALSKLESQGEMSHPNGTNSCVWEMR